VHEVTADDFANFARAAGLPDRQAAAEGATDARANLPATNVSLEEARAYAAARGARLPTQDELLRAARGGGRLRYPWGARFDPARLNSREAGRGAPEPVGARKAGVSVQGIADLLGNVAEWTETPADRHRFVVAGGSYRSYAKSPPAPYRLEPSARLPDVGFRLAKSLPPLLTDGAE
jgi:formylglycine-generating enzyme required for sulfatase activity